jgi:hypothetical protein
MQKKGLAISMIILLSLSLIALIIIGFLIARSSGIYTKSTSCENAGGKCVKSIDCEGERSFLAGCKEGEVCCIMGED